MEDIIAAIEQEAKYMQDSEQGGRHYRKGYVHALRAVSEFLISQSEPHDHESGSAAVQRLSAFAALQRSSRLDCTSPPQRDEIALREDVKIAADVFPSVNEYAIFSNSHLHTHSTHALSTAGHALCQTLSSRQVSTAKAGLVLEPKPDRSYHHAITIRQDRNSPPRTNTVTSSTSWQKVRQNGAIAR